MSACRVPYKSVPLIIARSRGDRLREYALLNSNAAAFISVNFGDFQLRQLLDKRIADCVYLGNPDPLCGISEIFCCDMEQSAVKDGDRGVGQD